MNAYTCRPQTIREYERGWRSCEIMLELFIEQNGSFSAELVRFLSKKRQATTALERYFVQGQIDFVRDCYDIQSDITDDYYYAHEWTHHD